MAQVATITCDFVRGSAPRVRESVETWRQPGVDGYGAHLLGKGGGEFNYQIVRFGTGAFIDTWFQAIEDLVGTIITIVDDWGVTQNDLIIVEVGPRLKTADIINGGSRGELQISGVQSADTPVTPA